MLFAIVLFFPLRWDLLCFLYLESEEAEVNVEVKPLKEMC